MSETAGQAYTPSQPLRQLALLELASDGTIQVATPMAESLLGRPPSDLIGRQFFAFLDENSFFRKVLAEMVKGERETTRTRTWLFLGEQAEQWLDISGALVRDANGEVGHLSLVLTDPSHGEGPEAANYYEEMFRRNTAPKLLIDPGSGYIVDANPAALGFYGYSITAIRHKRIQEINQLSEAAVRAEWEKARQEERRYFRFRHRLANDEVRDVEVYSGPIEIRGQTYLHSIIHDVTDEHQYRQSLEAYKALFEELPVGVYRNKPGSKGGFVYVNPAMLRIFGANSTSELLAYPTGSLYREHEARKQFSHDLLNTGYVENRELALQTLDGRSIWGSVTATKRQASDGQTVFDGIIQDITDRRKAEQERDRVIDSAPTGMIVVDSDGRIQRVNSEIEAMFGYERHELEGRDLHMLVPREARGRHRKMVTAYNQEPENRRMGAGRDLYAVRKDGTRFPVEIGLSWFGEGDERRTVAAIADITQRKEAEQELHRLVYEDALTGLLSARGFYDRLAATLAEPGDADPMGFVVQLDVQAMNDFNEAYGYPVGDALLWNIGARLNQALLPWEFVARVRSDQFAVFLDARERRMADEKDAYRWTAQQLAASIDIGGGRCVRINAFFGIAAVPRSGLSAEACIQRSEMALSAATRSDMSDWFVYTSDLGQTVRRRVSTTEKLRRGLEEGHLALFYQGQVDLGTNRVTGAEALMRWYDPEKGLQGPAAFMEVAEQSQLILPMGKWALQQACAHMRDWQAQGGAVDRVAVNIAVSQLTQTDLPTTVEAILRECEVAAEHLTLEITESMFANEHGLLLAQMEGLKDLGVRLALDDFGTGYSSLSYIHLFPFDEIKVDKTFVQNSVSQPYSREIVRMVAEVGKVLGVEVIAEGVETAEQADLVADLGCHKAQGFYYSRPVPEPEFARMDLVMDHGSQ